MSLPLISVADDYYCFNNPGSPGCEIPIELLTDSSYTSSSSLAAFNAGYVNHIVSDGGSFTSDSDGSNASSKDGNSIGSIGVISVFSKQLYVNVFPLTFQLSDNFFIEGSASTIVNLETGTSGMGDSSVGFAYRLNDTSFIDSFLFGARMSLATGDASKGFSTSTNIVTANSSLKNYSQNKLSYIGLNASYSHEVKIARLNSCSADYIDLGDSLILSATYTKIFPQLLSINLKYVSTNIDNTTIVNIEQKDGKYYQDFVMSINTSIYGLPFSTGVSLTYNQAYFQSFTDLNTIEEKHLFFSLRQPF